MLHQSLQKVVICILSTRSNTLNRRIQKSLLNGLTNVSSGGEFTRQTEVTFLGNNEKLVIKQKFSGIDEHGHLTITTEMEGRIPEIPSGASVHIEPYTELYHTSRSGKVPQEQNDNKVHSSQQRVRQSEKLYFIPFLASVLRTL